MTTPRRVPFLALCALLVVAAAPLGGCQSPQVVGGNIHLDEGRLDEAEAQYRAAVEADPRDPEAHFLLGNVLAMERKAIEAERHFARAVELNRSYRRPVEEKRAEYAAKYQNDAVGLMRESRLAEARQSLIAAETMSPHLARTVFLQGKLEEQFGREDSALDLYREAYDLDPADDETAALLAGKLLDRSQSAENAGRYAEAWDDLREALEIRPRDDLYYRQGTLAYEWAEHSDGDARRQRLNLSVEAFSEVLRRAPADQDAAYNLGAVLLAAERYSEAIGTYRRLLTVAPRDGEVWLALSMAHGRTGETALAQAEEAVGRALRADDPVEDPAAWARRSADRYPGGDLARTYAEYGVPTAVYTVRLGGALVEAWFYDGEKRVAPFREGALAGQIVTLP